MSNTQLPKITATERRLMALELRKGGATYRAIAKELGYGGPGAAYKAIDRALKEVLRDPAESVRSLELERLDAMLMGIWPSAKGGDPAAIDRVLKLMERRSRLLGLDAPVRTWMSGPEDAPLVNLEEIAERVDATIDQIVERRRAAGHEAPPEPDGAGRPSVPVDVLGSA